MKVILFLTSIMILSIILGLYSSAEGLANQSTTAPSATQLPTLDKTIKPLPPPNSSSPTIDTIFYHIFTKSNIIILFWFLAIYYLLYVIFQQNEFFSIGNFFDMTIFGIFIIYLVITYFFIPLQNQETFLQDIFISYIQYLDDPYSIFSLSLFLLVLYLILFLFRIPMDDNNKSFVISMVESLAWVTFALVIVADFFKYILGVPIVYYLYTGLSNLWNRTTPSDTTSMVTDPNATTDMSKNEVFHISNNIYTYDDAQAVCSSYGATLANYNQINDYYNEGGEFCGYGWSADQMALFPTQESSWKTLQKNEKKKNICGRPGINGGVFDPEYKFGVNCFGVKPPPTAQDLSCMKETPKTPEEVELEKKVQFFKENADSMMNVASFNRTKWSEW